jgi:hypothetical protein
MGRKRAPAALIRDMTSLTQATGISRNRPTVKASTCRSRAQILNPTAMNCAPPTVWFKAVPTSAGFDAEA